MKHRGKQNGDSNFINQCENCKKYLDEKSLLRHIGQRKNCKKFYGSRYDKLVHEKKLQIWRKCSKDTYDRKKKLPKEAVNIKVKQIEKSECTVSNNNKVNTADGMETCKCCEKILVCGTLGEKENYLPSNN